MLPHHKDWAVKRSLARMQKFAKDGQRGKARGRTLEQIAERAAFVEQGSKLLGAVFDRLDVRIVDMKSADGDNPYCNFRFRCLECGSEKIRTPDDGSDEGMCACSACGQEIMQYSILKGALHWLGLDEWRHGEPEKFKPAAADPC